MSIKNLNPENIKKLLKEFIGGSEDPDKIEKAYEEMDIQKANAAADGTLRASNGGCYEISKGVCFKIPKNEDEMSSPARNKGEKFDQSDFGIGVVEYDATIAPEQDGRPMVATVRTAQIRAKDNLRFAGYKGESIPTHHIYTVSGKKGTLYVRVVPTGTPIKKETKKPEKAVKGLPNCKPNFECGGVDELEVAQAHGKRSVPTVSQVRTALGLGEGGFDDSVIDAIMNFQVANKLRCDGCVGKLTHPVLSKMSKNYTTAVDVPPQKYNISGFYRGLYSGNKPTELLDYIKRTSSRDIFKSGGVVNRNVKKVSTAPKEEPKKQKKASDISQAVIMTVGDSLLESRTGIGDHLQKLFQGTKIYRAGRGGMSSSGILNGSRGKPGYLKAVEQVNPKILILNGGVNDILSMRKPDRVIRNLKIILEDANRRGIKTIYIPIVIPTRGTDTIYTNKKTGKSSKVFVEKKVAQERCVTVNKEMKSLCAANNAIYLSGVENIILNKKNKGDNLHLASVESANIAQLIKQKIDPILSNIIKESLQKILLGEQVKRPDLSNQAADRAARRVEKKLRNQWINAYYNKGPRATLQAKMGPVEHPQKPGVWLTRYRCKKLKDLYNLPEDYECRRFFTEMPIDASTPPQDEFIENDSMSYSDWFKDDGSENFGVPEQIGPTEDDQFHPCQKHGTNLSTNQPISFRSDGCEEDPSRFVNKPGWRWTQGQFRNTCGPGYVYITMAGPGWVDHSAVYGGYGKGLPNSFKKEDGVYPALEAWKKWVKDNNLQMDQCIEMTGQNKDLIFAAIDAWEAILNNKQYRTFFHRFATDRTLMNAVKPKLQMLNSAALKTVRAVKAGVDLAGEVKDKNVRFAKMLYDDFGGTMGEVGEIIGQGLNSLGSDFTSNINHKDRGEYTTAGWIYHETLRGYGHFHPDREFSTEETSDLWIGADRPSPKISGPELGREASRQKKYNNSMLLLHYGDEERYAITAKKISKWMIKHGYFTEQPVDKTLLNRLKLSRGLEEDYIMGFPDIETKVKFFIGMHSKANITSSDIQSLKSGEPSENFRKNYFRQKTNQAGGTRTYKRPGHMAETGVPYDDYEGHIRHSHAISGPTDLDRRRRVMQSKRMRSKKVNLSRKTWYDDNKNKLVDPGELLYPVRGFDGSRFGDNPLGQGWGDGPGNLNFNNEFYGIYKLIVDCLEYQPFALIDYSYDSRAKNMQMLMRFLDKIVAAEDILNVVPFFLNHTHEIGFRANNAEEDAGRVELLTVNYFSDAKHGDGGTQISRKANDDTVLQRIESLKKCHESMESPNCKQFGPWKKIRISGIDNNRAYLVNPLVGTEHENLIDKIKAPRVLYLDDETGNPNNPWDIKNVKKKYIEKDRIIEDAMRKALDPKQNVETLLKACCYYGDRFNPSYYFDKDSEAVDNRGMNNNTSRSTWDPYAATHRGGGMFKQIKAKGDKNAHGALAAYSEFFAMILPALPANTAFGIGRTAISSAIKSKVRRGVMTAKTGRVLAHSAAAITYVTEAATDVFLSYFFMDSMAQMFGVIGDQIRSTDKDEVQQQILRFVSEQQQARKQFLKDAISEIDANVSDAKNKIGSVDNFCSNTNHEMYFVNIFGTTKGWASQESESKEKQKRDKFIENISSSKAMMKYKNKMSSITKRMHTYNKFLEQETEILKKEIVNSVKYEKQKRGTLQFLTQAQKKYQQHVQRTIIQAGQRKRAYLIDADEQDKKNTKNALQDLIEKANLQSSETMELEKLPREELEQKTADPYWDRFYEFYYMLLSVCHYSNYEDEITQALDIDYIPFEEKMKTQGERKAVLDLKPGERFSTKDLNKALKIRKYEKDKNED